jgi:hypothetical protein
MVTAQRPAFAWRVLPRRRTCWRPRPPRSVPGWWLQACGRRRPQPAVTCAVRCRQVGVWCCQVLIGAVSSRQGRGEFIPPVRDGLGGCMPLLPCCSAGPTTSTLCPRFGRCADHRPPPSRYGKRPPVGVAGGSHRRSDRRLVRQLIGRQLLCHTYGAPGRFGARLGAGPAPCLGRHRSDPADESRSSWLSGPLTSRSVHRLTRCNRPGSHRETSSHQWATTYRASHRRRRWWLVTVARRPSPGLRGRPAVVLDGGTRTGSAR